MKSKENIKYFMIKELEMIQGIINRIEKIPLLIKTWIIVLIVILLLKGNKYHTFITFIPILAFWFLDAYFLRIGRLYNWVKDNRLKTKDFLFDLNYKRFEKEEQSILRIMFSITLVLFYGSIFAFTLIYVIFFSY